MPIEATEFDRWMGLIRDGLKGVNDRLDIVNGRIRETEKAIVRIDATIAERERQENRDPVARLGAGITAAVVIVAAVLAYFTR